MGDFGGWDCLATPFRVLEGLMSRCPRWQNGVLNNGWRLNYENIAEAKDAVRDDDLSQVLSLSHNRGWRPAERRSDYLRGPVTVVDIFLNGKRISQVVTGSNTKLVDCPGYLYQALGTSLPGSECPIAL
jgi:hypothetical protein